MLSVCCDEFFTHKHCVCAVTANCCGQLHATFMAIVPSPFVTHLNHRIPIRRRNSTDTHLAWHLAQAVLAQGVHRSPSYNIFVHTFSSPHIAILHRTHITSQYSATHSNSTRHTHTHTTQNKHAHNYHQNINSSPITCTYTQHTHISNLHTRATTLIKQPVLTRAHTHTR